MKAKKCSSYKQIHREFSEPQAFSTVKTIPMKPCTSPRRSDIKLKITVNLTCASALRGFVNVPPAFKNEGLFCS